MVFYSNPEKWVIVNLKIIKDLDLCKLYNVNLLTGQSFLGSLISTTHRKVLKKGFFRLVAGSLDYLS